MSREISNADDIIDSRDVIARIETLENEQADLLNGAQYDDLTPEARAAFDEWEGEYGKELDDLRKLADEASGSPNWQYGEGLIRDDYFEAYARDLAEDCGMIPRGLKWPCNCIDWEQAARELQADYFSVDFGGVEYWIRD